MVAESLSSAHTADAPATVISATAPRRRFLLARGSAGSAQGLPSPRPSLRPRLTAESGGFRPRQASHEPAARVVGRSRATEPEAVTAGRVECPHLPQNGLFGARS